jgi:hypothetical protein
MERMNGRGRGGMPPGSVRGRGGFGPGRGGYGGYGTPPPGGRGGYGPPGGRGGYGAPINRGGYGAPPRGGYGARGNGRTPPPYQGNMAAYGDPYDGRGGSPAYGPGLYGARQQSPGPPSAPGYGNDQMGGPPRGNYDAYDPQRNSLPRAESPPPLPGVDDAPTARQPVEMDAATGGTGPAGAYAQYGIRDSDADVAGMLAMQQARTSASTYSQDE